MSATGKRSGPSDGLSSALVAKKQRVGDTTLAVASSSNKKDDVCPFRLEFTNIWPSIVSEPQVKGLDLS
jgi:hypothetical protein